ncbi:MAG: rod shape-determining protein RodA [Deltaproteobacteria bacterium]|jgi:rod shape determining protein RodA|nr:rod shape-determining protein RodA [Deltaproteobacteria bacterium]
MTQGVERRNLVSANWVLVLLTLVLAAIGLLNLYSASVVRLGEGTSVAAYFQKQCLWMIIGVFCMFFCMFLDYRRLISSAEPMLVLSVLLLLLLLFFGPDMGGVKRWIPLGPVNFQPSEAVKISVMLLGAKLLAKGKDPLTWREFFPILSVGFVPAVLVLKQPDLGTAIIIMFILGGMMLYRGLKAQIIKVGVLVLILSPLAVDKLIMPRLLDYQRARITGFLSPEKAPAKAVYQSDQSRIAIGSGKIWGKGYLEGTQSKLRFIPARHTDFALAVFGEEWGFTGCVALMTLFCLFLLSIYTTIRETKDRFGGMLGAGIFFYFFWQILINVGMVLGLMPVVGIPLPFISYGGSSAVVNFCMVGLLLNISMRRFVFRAA